MKVIVFVKQIKYVYAQTGIDPKQNFIGPDDIVHIMNAVHQPADIFFSDYLICHGTG